MSNLNLPSGWTTTTLGTFMDFKNGVNADKDAYGKGIKFVNVMDIFRKNCLSGDDVTGSVEITDKQLNEYSVVRGDILFNRTSETPEEIAFSSVYLGEEKITFGGFVIRGRQTKQLLLPEFAKYCFKTDTIRKEMIRRSQGAVRANIGQKDLSKVPIVIPPETDQKMIVSILDEWGHMIEKTEALIDAKERQFVWLLKKLIIDNKQLKEGKNNWTESQLGDIGTIVTGNTPSKRDQDNYGGSYCWATAEDFCNRYIRNTKIKLTEKGRKIARFVPPGSVLVTCIGSIGLNAIAKIELATNQQINSIIPNPQHDSDFIYYLLQNGKNKLKALAGTGGVLMLNKSEFSKIKFLFPTLEEQKHIANTLNTAQQEITLLKKLADQYRTQKRGLMQKLLSGEWHIKNKEAA